MRCDTSRPVPTSSESGGANAAVCGVAGASVLRGCLLACRLWGIPAGSGQSNRGPCLSSVGHASDIGTGRGALTGGARPAKQSENFRLLWMSSELRDVPISELLAELADKVRWKRQIGSCLVKLCGEKGKISFC
jgi:hypothetical protein